MVRPASAVAKDIDEFQPKDGDWLRFENLLQELFSSESPQDGIGALLRVFERSPVDEDGFGGYWAIVHELEKMVGYEEQLVESVRSSPSTFGLTMINSLLNGGIDKIGDTRLLHLLEATAKDQTVCDALRSQAKEYFDLH